MFIKLTTGWPLDYRNLSQSSLWHHLHERICLQNASDSGQMYFLTWDRIRTYEWVL
jgi:hypothetical protein